MPGSEPGFVNLDFLSWAKQREEFLCGRIWVLKKAAFWNSPKFRGLSGLWHGRTSSCDAYNTIGHRATQSKMLFPLRDLLDEEIAPSVCKREGNTGETKCSCRSNLGTAKKVT